MNASKLIEIKLFGAFREYNKNAAITISAEDNLSVVEIKQIILRSLPAGPQSEIHLEELLKHSVLATEQSILQDSDRILFKDLGALMSLAILPPVCGG